MRERNALYELKLRVNGETRLIAARPGDTLLRLLREELGLTGAKLGCENGDCGACTVLIDGRPVKSCMTLAVEMEGREIVTIEGLEDEPLRQAFLEENGYQCGFCTPGMILNAHALLAAHPTPTREEKREWLSSNLCRCTGYEGISKAVEKAARHGDH
jgi:carbon-monoxide dehydrogenase small subunit